MEQVIHDADLCIVGAGMAGVGAAISAARQGIKTILMHDRPIPGGNASSECRVNICGADRHNGLPNLRETGVLEELRLNDLYNNMQRSPFVFDSAVYDILANEPNLTVLYNCSCCDATMDGDLITSLKGWQTTTQQWQIINAKLFSDCSGDSILAPLTDADTMWGTEGKDIFNEPTAADESRQATMGMCCLFQSKNMGHPVEYHRPEWTYHFPNEEDLPPMHTEAIQMGYWWLELGGLGDSIADTEKIRHELLRIVFGVCGGENRKGDQMDGVTNIEKGATE